MKISIEISVGTTKRLIALGVVGASLAAGSLAWGKLRVWDPAKQEPLTATELNGNFAELQEKIVALEAAADTDAKINQTLQQTTYSTSFATSSPPAWVPIPGLLTSITIAADQDVDIDGLASLRAAPPAGSEPVKAECFVRITVDGVELGLHPGGQHAAILNPPNVPYTAQLVLMHRHTLKAGTRLIQLEASSAGKGVCDIQESALRVRSSR